MYYSEVCNLEGSYIPAAGVGLTNTYYDQSALGGAASGTKTKLVLRSPV